MKKSRGVQSGDLVAQIRCEPLQINLPERAIEVIVHNASKIGRIRVLLEHNGVQNSMRLLLWFIVNLKYIKVISTIYYRLPKHERAINFSHGHP